MKKSSLIILAVIFANHFAFCQDFKNNDRWFIQPHLIFGNTTGNDNYYVNGVQHKNDLGSGWGYGAGMRCLYDFKTDFMGSPLWLGMEASYLSTLGVNPTTNDNHYDKNNPQYVGHSPTYAWHYLIIAPVLEQNYKWFKHGFQLGTGIGYYKDIKGVHDSWGIITNIGWFPIYKDKRVTPYITYRNDWIFDRNATNVNGLGIGLNF